MAIGFRSLTQAGSGGATDPTSATTLPSGTATGDLVVAVCEVKYASTTITPPSGWQVVTNSEAFNTTLTDSGNDAGNIRLALFFREKDAGWSTIPGYDLSGVPNITMIGAITYTKGAGEVWAAPVCANAVDNSTGVTTGIDPPASGTTIPFAAGDWFGSVAAVNGDAGTLGAHTVTVAGVTFGTQVTRLNATTTGGTDLRCHSVDYPYTSGTASAGPDGSLALTTGATTCAGVMVFYKLSLVSGTTVSATFNASLDAVTATMGAEAKHPVIMGSSLGAVTATIGAYAVPPGPFTVDFSLYADGPVPEQATGLRDSFLDIPRSQDEMGIRGGKLAVVNFRGVDQAFYPTDTGGGRRGLLWRNTQTLTDNVSGVYDGSMYTGSPPAVPAMQPALHISTDPADTWLGIAVWFVPAPYSWAELGVIGWKQEDFSYLDMAPGLTPSLLQTDDIRLRSVGGQVAVEINGVTVLGPCPIPAEILGSPIHGVQMDVAADTDEELGVMESVIIEADSTPLDTRSAPLTPGVGTQVEAASSTTINVPYPTTVVAGETLLCIVCTRNGGTISAAGWTDVPTSFGLAVNTSIRVIRKTATGSESGNLTVTKSTAGVMAGMMVRASGEEKASTVLAGQGNGTASTNLPSPVSKILGPRRTSIWIGATSIDTNITLPAGYTALSLGVSGGQAVRMGVGVALVDAHPNAPVYPYNSYIASNFPAQTGTAASSTTSAVGQILLFPAYAGTPITTVPATMAATLGAVTATIGATVTHPPVPAIFAASLSGPTATIAATPKHPATMAASLGAVTATITATPKHPATFAASLGAVTATISAKVKVPVTLAAQLSAVTATISAYRRYQATFAASLGAVTATLGATVTTGTVTRQATMAAQLSAVTGSISAKVKIPTTMASSLGTLTATISSKVRVPGIFTASLGTVTATIAAGVKRAATFNASLSAVTAVISATVRPKVQAIFSASLGTLTATITSKVKVPVAFSASLGTLSAAIIAKVRVPAGFSASLGTLTAIITATPRRPAIFNASLSSITASIQAKVRVPAGFAASLDTLTASISAKVRVPATFNASLVAVSANITTIKISAIFGSALSSVTATINAAAKRPATFNASLGTLIATISAKVKIPVGLSATLGILTATISGKVKIPAIFSALLSGPNASISMSATVRVATFSAPLGSVNATVSPKVRVPAIFVAPLGPVTATAGVKIKIPVAFNAPLSGVVAVVSPKVKIPAVFESYLESPTATITAKAVVPAVFFAPLDGLRGRILSGMESIVYLGDTEVIAIYVGDKQVQLRIA